MIDSMPDAAALPAGWYQRLAAHPALRRFPASLLGLWLSAGGAGARPLAAGASWDGCHAAPDCVGVWLPDDPALDTEFAGLASLAGIDEARPERRCGASGWLLQLPAASLREALQHDAALGAGLAAWGAAQDPAAPPLPTGAAAGPGPYAWLGVLALPLALGAGLPLLGLSGAAANYLASVSIGLWVWLRHLAPPFVGALLILAALVLSNTVPGAVAFAGFADAGVLLLISILALGYVTQTSGLVQRMMQTLLRRIPATAKGYHAGLLGLGFLLTLILPGSAARLQLISSIAAKLGERVAGAGRPFAHLALAAFSGVTAVSTVFLTSNPINFLVLGLLPEQWRLHFGWTTWLVAALGFLLPFTLLYGALFWHLTRRAGSAPLADAPTAASGAWHADEIVAALAIALFALGAAGAGWHHIAVPIAGLAVYLWLTAYGFLKEDGAQPQINWPMVLYLSAMIGLVRGFNALGLEHELSRALEWLPALARWNAPLFLVALIGITVLLRLILPALVCVSVLCVMLIPLMSATSVNPWLIAFIVSTTAEGWFLPYQSSDYQLFRASIGSALNRDEERFIRLNAVVQGLKLLALALAIPYWQWLGIL